MKHKRIYYQLIIDRSGSMYACMEQMVEGINQQVMRIKEVAGRNTDHEMITSLSLFNDDVIPVWDRLRPEELQEITFADYRPAGNTALLDAIGITTDQLRQTSDAGSGVPDTSFSVIIVTDGYENASRFFTPGQISELIRNLELTGKWTFTYIGATLDAVSVAANLGIRRENAMYFSVRDARMMFSKLEISLEYFFKDFSSFKESDTAPFISHTGD